MAAHTYELWGRDPRAYFLSRDARFRISRPRPTAASSAQPASTYGQTAAFLTASGTETAAEALSSAVLSVGSSGFGLDARRSALAASLDIESAFSAYAISSSAAAVQPPSSADTASFSAARSSA